MRGYCRWPSLKFMLKQIYEEIHEWIKKLITTNSERLVANGLTPHFAFGKQRTDSQISGNCKITS